MQRQFVSDYIVRNCHDDLRMMSLKLILTAIRMFVRLKTGAVKLTFLTYVNSKFFKKGLIV